MKRRLILVLAIVMAALAVDYFASAPKPLPQAEPLKLSGLENLYRVDDHLYSGGVPEGDDGFLSLQKLGVKTIISVDGTPPDLENARKGGFRYVHIPLGYDGVSAEKAFQLAKAVRSLPGPVYVHCHHGKHRGPAAIAAIRYCLDREFTSHHAMEWMRQAGTDEHYEGLYQATTRFPKPSLEELDRLSDTFPEKAAVAELARRMVTIDRHWDQLKGKSPTRKEATLLKEEFREAARQESNKSLAALLLKTSSDLAERLETHLDTRESIEDDLRSLKKACSECHHRFRDQK